MFSNNSDNSINNESTGFHNDSTGFFAEKGTSSAAYVLTKINQSQFTNEVTTSVTNWSDFVENVTEFINSTDTSDEVLCKDWLDAQHAVFQLAHLCILISFLTPSTFKHHCFFLRIMLCIGYLLIVIWSVLFMCMTDMLVWNVVFLVANFIHLFYLGYKIVPDRFTKTLDEVYNRSFKPLRITRKQFKDLVEFGNMVLLPKGALYAKHGHHKIGQKLSILLKGRLKVSYEDLYLHCIEVNQFVDSPEYDCVSENSNEDTFQVTISASEDCLLFTWPYKRLKDHLSTDPVIAHVFNQVIGKDISQKLYEIQERQLINPGYNDYMSDRRSSMVNVRHSLVSSSGTNLDKLNCLQGCIVHTEQQPSNQSSLGTYETCV